VFQIEPHYFQPKELTEKPQVLQDVFPTAKLSLPGVSIQSVVVRLLINEPGEADRGEIDESGLTDEAKGVVAQAFSKLKFYPGKLDDSFVKSQLRLRLPWKILLRYASGLRQRIALRPRLGSMKRRKPKRSKSVSLSLKRSEPCQQPG
jgi:hypothetical protein